ncbi:MAG: hypothetical protein U5R06_02255 [candidate division KSB1 bacterium]|nr:hypothetical protein [candidate division KSB1 bacterium]
MFATDAWKIIARMYCPRQDKNCKPCPEKTRCIRDAKSTSLYLQKTFTLVPKDEQDIQPIYRKHAIDDAKILDETPNPVQSNPKTRQGHKSDTPTKLKKRAEAE